MDIKVYEIKTLMAQNAGDTAAYFAEIEKHLGHHLKNVTLEEFLDADFRLVFIATGGSEENYKKIHDKLKDKPVYLLTSGVSNSLAASMEILSYLQNTGTKGEILHGSPEAVAKRLSALYKAAGAKEKLFGARLGLVGPSSDWLISSAPNAEALREKLDMRLVDISMEEFEDEIRKADYAPNQWTDQLLAMGYDRKETENALYVYGALRRLVDKYALSAVTVRCFDLLTSVKTTGCLGLAILNAEGVWAGCEGDVPSLVSMCILGAISGKPVFMCNPSRIDAEKGAMVLAHCTLPVDMPYEMTLTTHFESGIGVAIAGSIAEGPCTVFKTSGDLSRHVALLGTITENLREARLCRSQIRVTLPDFGYFTKNPISNHHIVCVGDETAALEEFFAML